MIRTLGILCLAAILEISGDALTRVGLQGRPLWGLVGALTLVAYGVMVNQSHIDFGRLMGIYIAVFFVISQAIAIIMFRSTPDLKLVGGGLLIIAGGLCIAC